MDNHSTDEITLSFVCPVHNAAADLESFHEKLKAAADAIGETYEIIFVNDGSDDDSLDIVRSLAKRDGSIRYIDFSRRHGSDIALIAGYDHAGGQAAISLDCGSDSQIDQISLLLERWQAGGEIIQAAPDTDDDAAAEVCTFRLLDCKVLRAIESMHDRPRTVAELLDWVGFKRVTLRYPAGDADKVIRPSAQQRLRRRAAAVATLSMVSLRLVAVTGILLCVGAVGYGLIVGVLTLLGLATFSLLLLAALALTGVQLVALAAVGHFVARLHQRTTGRPLYVVRYAHGFAAEEPEAVEPPDHDSTVAARFTVMT